MGPRAPIDMKGRGGTEATKGAKATKGTIEVKGTGATEMTREARGTKGTSRDERKWEVKGVKERTIHQERREERKRKE